ncbi:MAG: type II CAAX endopeptidase family protein [Verrucomicrobia bacterium]|nr:type II CAAX endopeptidase family protein [Verrucomicrobiota bacterium]
MSENSENSEPTDPTDPLAPIGVGDDPPAVVPPPLPTVWRHCRVSLFAMLGLFVVVAFVFWGQHFLDEPEPPALEHIRYGNIAGQLQLVLQGKMIVGQGLAAEKGGPVGVVPDIDTSLTAMADQVETLDGAAARALAALHFFMKPDDVDGALARLEAVQQELEPGEAEIQAMVRQQINSPGTLTPKQLDELQYQMHWFAHPLLLARENQSHPDRQKLMLNVMLLFIFTACVAVCFTVGFLVGLVLLAMAAVRHASGLRIFTFDEAQGGSQAHLWAFIAYLGLMGSPILLIALKVENPTLTALAGPVAFFLSILAGVMIAIGFSRGSFGERTRALGLHSGRGIFREIGSGIVGYCCVLPITAIGGLVTLLLWWLTSFFPATEGAEPVTGHPIGEMFFDASALTRFLLLLLAAVGAPLIEETMFRGVLHRGLRRSFSIPVAGLIAAICFAAVHPQDIVALPVLAALAFGFMLIREWRDSLIAPMVAHGLHNGTLMLGLWIGTM